jgi:GNAT superfamily N-acetyltransferase
MIFREATILDITQIQLVRNSVKENRLSNAALISDKDCENYLTVRGKGWVCDINNTVVGFSIVDLHAHNVWALFIHPDYERLGLGKKLQSLMLDWYFNQTKEKIWLSTAPDSIAEKFYRKAGWKEVGVYGKGEIKFEITAAEWNAKRELYYM